MRRAQTSRHQPRQSLDLRPDNIGLLKGQDESTEDFLRRQLVVKDKEVENVNNPLMILMYPYLTRQIS